MNNWKIGCFFSTGTIYESIFEKFLRNSCRNMELANRLIFITTDNKGSWIRNVAEKPRVIRHILDFCASNECLVFLDVDATIEKYPILFDEIPEEYDIAVHRLNWNLWYGYNDSNPRKELLSGTMFFRNNDKVKTLCDDWYSKSSNSTNWEQKVLELIIDDHMAKGLRVYELPLEYIYIKSRPNGLEPLIKVDPVIVHHQVSRYYKRNLSDF